MASVAIQTADVCPLSVDVSDIATPGTPIAVVDCLKPDSDISFIDTQPSTSTFPGNTLVSEKLFPQKSICSELTCTGSDTDSDDIYMPGSSAESQDDIDSESDDETKRSPAEQKKLIVFEENLDKLFFTCSTCFRRSTHYVWMDTMAITTKKNANIAGNALLAGSILFSGNSFQNTNSFAHRLNLAFIGKSFFYDIQKEFLFSVVNKAWKDHQENLFKEVKKLKKLDICGDGRCDSPGHSAKYGTYTVMAESTNKLLDFSVVQVTKLLSSNAMEAEACRRVLAGTAAHVALEGVVFNKKLLKDLKLVTEFHHTGILEVYHSRMLKYCSEKQRFSHEGMVACQNTT